MAHGKFVTAINCMDGRVQEPVIKFLKDKYGANYVDMVTKAGPIKILDELTDREGVEAIREMAELSAKLHHSRALAIVGHHDCGGNPVDRTTQEKQIASSIMLAKTWDIETEIIGLYVTDKWVAEQVM